MQVTVKSRRVRAHWLAYMIVMVVACSAFVAAWSARQDHLWNQMRDAAEGAARDVGVLTHASLTNVYMLQGTANGLFRVKSLELSPEHHRALVARLDLPGVVMMMPSARTARLVMSQPAPAFSMVGQIPDRHSEVAREIEIALALGPALVHAQSSQSATKAAYYLSGKGFHTIYPATADDLQLFSSEMPKREPFQNGLPDKNSARIPIWSDAYDDPKGNGLISTLSIPIDDENGHYRGIAALDFQLDGLSQYVRRPGLGIGTAFILNDKDHVIAHPTLVPVSAERAPTLGDVARQVGLASQWEQLRTVPANNRIVAHGHAALVYDIGQSPWRYVLVVDQGTLRWAALRTMPQEAVGLLILMLLLAYLESRRRQAVIALRGKAAEEVLEAAPAPVAVVRQSDLSVEVANAALLDLFGLSGRESEQDTAAAYRQLQDLVKALTQQASQSRDTLNEATLQRADGSTFWVLVRCVPVKHEAQEAWLCSLTDVSALKLARDQLETLATTDPLTGTLNRRAIGEKAEGEMHRAARNGHRFAALLLDIDHFKRINDTHGHPAGDRVLQLVAAACVSALRTVDTFGRWGGEEFIALLPDTEAEGAMAAAERMRRAVEDLRIETEDHQIIATTVSVGVSVWDGSDDTLEALLTRSDAALYRAKESGRNRACLGTADMDLALPPGAASAVCT